MSQPNAVSPNAAAAWPARSAASPAQPGIAEAAALRFAAEGARLFVVALREEDCVALAESIGTTTEITWVAADLTDEGETERAFARCAETFGRLDALLACAGGSGRPFGDGPLHSTSLESWNTTVSLNLNTAFLSSREAVKIMLDQPTGGSIVYVSSVAATNPVAGTFNTLAYCGCEGRDQLADAQRRLPVRRGRHSVQRDPAGIDVDTDVEARRLGSRDARHRQGAHARVGRRSVVGRRSRPGRAILVQRRVEAHHRPADPGRRWLGRELASSGREGQRAPRGAVSRMSRTGRRFDALFSAPLRDLVAKISDDLQR